MQTTLKVQGMSCGHCVSAVEKALTNIGASGKVDLAAGLVTVEYDDARLSLGDIKTAIDDQGYTVE